MFGRLILEKGRKYSCKRGSLYKRVLPTKYAVILQTLYNTNSKFHESKEQRISKTKSSIHLTNLREPKQQ